MIVSNINFALLLLILTCITGLIVITDYVLQAVQRAKNISSETPWLVQASRFLFPVVFIVLLLRSFVLQNYFVPTGSLEPTLLRGEFVLVNQFAYGLHLPVWHTRIIPIGQPQRGDIALFRWPVDTDLTFIKRVIGLPGDRIDYIDKVLYINGQKAPQTLLKQTTDHDAKGLSWPVRILEENLNGVTHLIYTRPDRPAKNFYHLRVPKDHYFMMGDNRDDSDDSRYWGFVPTQNLSGRGWRIWLSWDAMHRRIRWSRLGQSVHEIPHNTSGNS